MQTVIKKRYSVEFRVRAVELVRSGKPVSVVAEELGIGTSVLYRWLGQGPHSNVVGLEGSAGPGEEPPEVELRRLRRESLGSLIDAQRNQPIKGPLSQFLFEKRYVTVRSVERVSPLELCERDWLLRKGVGIDDRIRKKGIVAGQRRVQFVLNEQASQRSRGRKRSRIEPGEEGEANRRSAAPLSQEQHFWHGDRPSRYFDRMLAAEQTGRAARRIK